LSYHKVQPYSQLPTSPYLQTRAFPFPALSILDKSEEKKTNPRSFVSSTDRFPAKPRRFQKLISNSLALDQDLGRNFKYDFHPEEKLSLAFFD